MSNFTNGSSALAITSSVPTPALSLLRKPLDVGEAASSVRALYQLMITMKDRDFHAGMDYDQLPGMNKPTLLQPGAEKIMRALGVRAEFVRGSGSIIDFEKPLFHYEYEARMVDIESGLVVASAYGSCNSKEAKYRWRKADRTCPNCGQATIMKSKYPDRQTGEEGRFYCNTKAGGCGAGFGSKDPAILNQALGRVENPDIYDQVNTIDKMAQKRAMMSAVKSLAAVSEFFTVDVEREDLIARGELRDDEIPHADARPAPQPQQRQQAPAPAQDDPDPDLGQNEKARAAFFGEVRKRFNMAPGDAMQVLGVKSLNGIHAKDALAKLETASKSAQPKADKPTAPKADSKPQKPAEVPLTPTMAEDPLDKAGDNFEPPF